MKNELKVLAWLSAVFAGVYFLPVGEPRFDKAVLAALELVKWYAREHVILCLLPAFWIAGAISAFLSKGAVMKYLGPGAPKAASYGVASVSGTILAVCSCTVLPLFSGIYRMGAGLGPATAFLYSGPAINALAMILTARVLGWQIGLARAIGAVGFSLLVGALMAWIFRHDEQEKSRTAATMPDTGDTRPLWRTASFFAVLVGILVVANWGDGGSGFFAAVHAVKWPLTSGLALVLAVMLRVWNRLPAWRIAGVVALTAGVGLAFPGHAPAVVLVATLGLAWLTAGRQDPSGEWFSESWSNARQIMPLLLGGVFFSGLLLGRPGHDEGLIPSAWIVNLVGGNSVGANFFASLSGAFMYFATLTEVPIVQGLLGGGMGKGPALALLLAGPALSLPSMVVISSIIGPRKTFVYGALVVLLATLTGWIFGSIS